MTSANLILDLLILHMELYCVDKRLKTHMPSKCSLGFLNKWLKSHMQQLCSNGLETIRDKCVEICLMAIYKHTA
jgi:hypothetical protein